ncbi:hypothetical protein WJ0W_001813 [Paenibacillus melissococcoides]|uniref:Uncharacterized protein n=1 Tax=Paenibacillus melissococcoides TaxID=2912268 RepID=A0ABN8U4N7_9BACL|nr:hypothetical protein [Paenibacillus melissococcoides]MEB9895792.1 hypothetical protein [Bacillus cereus]CAH8244580.1 hypothetical protein WJ0W_001813 [Paenibacillus melissococcoides]CAH8708405.1 hypothetical protein WDD9_001900 [Paenibacillus melissococcoides]CAH8709113.1 hypothetical protein HTL2_002185 [Paenibacillus melissococcoides]
MGAAVCGVERDRVQLKLDLDEEHDATEDGCWFPYMTTYVAEGHTGWYSMPDLGERVQLYLPSAREAEAVVRGALRSRDPGRKPEAKAWHNKQGNGFELVANELRLHAGSGMVIRLDEQSGVKIRSSGSIAIRGCSFSAQAGQRWNMEAGEAIYLRGGESSLVLDGESDLRSGLLTQEGSVKAPVHVTDLEPVPEPPLMTVEAYTAAQEAKTQASSVSPINGAQIGKMMAAALTVLGMIPIASTTGRLAQSSLGTLAMMPVASGSTGPSIINSVIRGMKNAHLTNEEKELNRQMYGEFTFLLGKVFTGAKGLREPQTKETLVNFLIHFSRSVEIGASRVPDEVWETNNRLNRLIERFQAIDTLHLPNQLRKQGMRDILFGSITDPEHYNAWEDNRLSLEDKIKIANGLEEQFHDEPNVRQLNFFFVRERTTYDIPPGFRIGMPKFIKSAISPLKVVNGKLRVWTGDKFLEYKVGQNMVKESFKNGIQGLRESLENMADNNKFGLKVAPAGGYIYSNKSTVKKPSELTKTQKNYWNVMESNSGKGSQGKGQTEGAGSHPFENSKYADEIASNGHQKTPSQILLGAKEGKGMTNIGYGDSKTAIEAGKAWVGNGFKEIRDKKTGDLLGFSSEDGLRAFRLQYKPRDGVWKANYQENTRVTNSLRNGKIETLEIRNAHIWITDLKDPSSKWSYNK